MGESGGPHTNGDAHDGGSAHEGGEAARRRLVDAMAAVVGEKGYAATTIADVVARAHVSRRTFYEHFADKEECLLACHTVLSDHMFAALAAVDTDGLGTAELIAALVRALLGELAARPELTLAHFVEMQAAGVRARAARRAVQDRFAEVLRGVAAQAQAADGRVTVPSAALTTAVVGGIGELIVQSVEQGSAAGVAGLAPTVVELVTAVVLRG